MADTVRDFLLLDDLGEALVRLALADRSRRRGQRLLRRGRVVRFIALAMAAVQGKPVEIRRSTVQVSPP